MKKKILLFSTEMDVHADKIQSFESPNAEFIRLNLDAPKLWGLSYQNGNVIVSSNGKEFDLSSIGSVFVRRIPNLNSFVKAVPAQYAEYASYLGQQEFTLFSDCLAILDATVTFVNPLKTSANSGKAVQAKLAIDVGLLTPETYIGSDPYIARKFCDDLINANREICTKPVNNTSVRIDGEEKIRFTTKLDPSSLEDIDSLVHCPIIFQAYIEKQYEIRATVIGSKIYAAKIDSQAAGGHTAVDWRRYNIPKTPHSPYKLPQEVEKKILDLHDKLGLIYSSFDFIRTVTGEYVFLETNPYGQWLWIEDLTGLNISQGIADYLASTGT